MGGASCAIFAIPAFLGFQQASDGAAVASLCFFAVVIALWGAPMCAWMIEAFPTNLRFTAVGPPACCTGAPRRLTPAQVAIGYNVGQAIFGGSVEVRRARGARQSPRQPGSRQALATLLTGVDKTAAGYLVAAVAVFALIGLRFVAPKHPGSGARAYVTVEMHELDDMGADLIPPDQASTSSGASNRSGPTEPWSPPGVAGPSADA